MILTFKPFEPRSPVAGAKGYFVHGFPCTCSLFVYGRRTVGGQLVLDIQRRPKRRNAGVISCPRLHPEYICPAIEFEAFVQAFQNRFAEERRSYGHPQPESFPE